MTYKIIRFHQRDRDLNFTVEEHLTLEEAQAHTNDPDTSSTTATSREARIYTATVGQDWFDGYTREEE